MLTIVLAESPTRRQEPFNLHIYVVDLRVKKLVKFVRRLLGLPVCFVGFDLKKVCFCLWRIKIAVPGNLWDILIHEKATALGQYHFSQKPDGEEDDFIQQIRGKTELRKLEQFQLGLPSICQRYGVPYQKTPDSDAIEEATLASMAKRTLPQRQINYVVKDAVAAAEIYPNQIYSAVQTGILQHLVTIEMPFITTMAAIEWEGFRVHRKRGDWINRKCVKVSERVEKETPKTRY